MSQLILVSHLTWTPNGDLVWLLSRFQSEITSKSVHSFGPTIFRLEQSKFLIKHIRVLIVCLLSYFEREIWRGEKG